MFAKYNKWIVSSLAWTSSLYFGMLVVGLCCFPWCPWSAVNWVSMSCFLFCLFSWPEEGLCPYDHAALKEMKKELRGPWSQWKWRRKWQPHFCHKIIVSILAVNRALKMIICWWTYKPNLADFKIPKLFMIFNNSGIQFNKKSVCIF